MTGLITPHFSWREAFASDTATRKGIFNEAPPELYPNISTTASQMELVRSELGGALKINSWFRCLALNTAVGGSKTSYHPLGLAVDFKPTTVGLKVAFEILSRSAILFDQLIQEGTKDGAFWIHIGFPKPGAAPRRDIMRATGDKLGGKMHFTRVAAG